jgi:predicted nucleic acid-binding protein
MAVLDTDFLIALEQDDAGAVEWLHERREEEHLVPDFVVVEYLTGHSEPEEALDLIEKSFTILHGDLEWIRASVSLRKKLRRKGVRFRTPDFWIASWAHYRKAPVITRNRRHFRALGVPAVSW